MCSDNVARLRKLFAEANNPELTSTETCDVILSRRGKFHRPKETTHERMAWLRPMVMVCGSTTTPLNVYRKVADALRYCGGRTEPFCKICFKPEDLK